MMKKYFLGIIFFASLIFFYTNCTQNAGVTVVNPVSGAVSGETQLKISSIPAAHGIFDASLAQDPTSNRIWMSYSTINPSVMWPVQNFDAVATRLAYSDDQGITWIDSAALTAVTDVDLNFLTQPPFNLGQEFRAGTWQNEVSALVYDVGATDVNQKWKLLFMHYLQINANRHFEHLWLGLKMAMTPQLLASAPEQKLFSGAAYDAANNTSGGPTAVPVNGSAAIALDTAIAQLSGCVFAEPGFLSTSSSLFLSFLCVKNNGAERSIMLLKCANPCNVTTVGGAHGWIFAGTALTSADAALLGFDQGYSAPNLVSANGQYYLIATPVKSTPFDGYYSGCKIFRFTDLNSATLQRSGGAPVILTSVENDAGTFGGACTYLPSADKAGIIRSQLYINSTEKFRLFKTGIKF